MTLTKGLAIFSDNQLKNRAPRTALKMPGIRKMKPDSLIDVPQLVVDDRGNDVDESLCSVYRGARYGRDNPESNEEGCRSDAVAHPKGTVYEAACQSNEKKNEIVQPSPSSYRAC